MVRGRVRSCSCSCSYVHEHEFSCSQTFDTHRLEDAGSPHERWAEVKTTNGEVKTTLGGHAMFPLCGDLIDREQGEVRNC